MVEDNDLDLEIEGGEDEEEKPKAKKGPKKVAKPVKKAAPADDESDEESEDEAPKAESNGVDTKGKREAFAVKFGQRLRAARNSAGLSALEVEKKLGLTAGTLRKYETGYQLPNLYMATVIAKVIKSSCSELQGV